MKNFNSMFKDMKDPCSHDIKLDGINIKSVSKIDSKRCASIKRLKLITIIAVLLLSFNVQSQDTWEYRNDKRAHALTGYALGASMTNAMIQSGKYKKWETVVAPQIFTSLIAGLKEGIDHSFKLNGFFSHQDFTYTVGGSFIGSLKTLTEYELSDWMLRDGRHGLFNSYVVPVFCSSGISFVAESVMFMTIDSYRPSIVNLAVQTVVSIVSMSVKHHYDKKNNKLEKFKL